MLLMRILVTGGCGFVGFSVAVSLKTIHPNIDIHLLDNLSRKGSELNIHNASSYGFTFHHGDVRISSDLISLPLFDWIVDASANPSVLAGIRGSDTYSLFETNLIGTINILELCKKQHAGLILLSTSRVYSIKKLSSLDIIPTNDRFSVSDKSFESLSGITQAGITEDFSVKPPISLYGASKLASETIALEYNFSFDIPLWINRCGVIAGPGQFARPDQGIFAFWLHSWFEKRSLRYIGFNGSGLQVRDCMHPYDLATMIIKQVNTINSPEREIIQNLSGGAENSMSLRELSAWCTERWGSLPIISEQEQRPFDLPWVILDSSIAKKQWDWSPQYNINNILLEISHFAERNPEWLSKTR